MYDQDEPLLPCGSTLPPSKTMRCQGKLIGKIKLKVVNENQKAASISIDGVGHFVPGSDGTSAGVLNLSNWHFGKTFTIKNQCDWVLAIERQ